MANVIKVKRGLSSDLASLTLQEGEIAFTTDTKKLYISSTKEPINNNTTYSISKSGSTITLTGSDGSTSTVSDSDTKVTVDSALSSTSTNPVQNKVINTALASKANTSAIPTKTSQLTNDSGFKTTDNNTTYTLTQDSSDGHKITLTPSSGTATTITIPDNNTTYSNMTAATASAAGKAGLVPAPAAGKQASFLRGDGTWVVPTNTTYSAATTSAAGLMSAADKTKLDGIATSANNYSHPTSSGNKHIPSGGSSGQILRWSADGTATWGADNNTTYSAATQSADGLMSAADKTKLDGMDTGATKNTASSTTPKAAGTASVGSEAAYARGDHVHAAQTTVSGNAGSATKLATARNFTIGKTAKSFNGTAAVSWTLDEIGSNVYVGTSAPSDADVDVWIDPTGSVNLSALWNSIYPVGAIYMSVSSTNPGTLFPGTTWTALQDRFLVGAGNSYAVNATGGHKDLQSHTHSIPALSGTAAASTHSHIVTTKTTTYAQGSQSAWRCLSWPGTNTDYSQTVYTNNGTADGSHTHSVTTTASTSGSTGAGNGGNLPPYLAVYMWKRTA